MAAWVRIVAVEEDIYFEHIFSLEERDGNEQECIQRMLHGTDGIDVT